MRHNALPRLILCAVLLTVLWPPQTPCAGTFAVTAVTDRPEALYHVGETVTFRATVTEDGRPLEEGKVRYVLSNDGAEALAAGILDLAGERPEVTGSLDRPGFLRCQFSYKASDGKAHSATAAGGFDPLEIKPSMGVPEDFDAFWAGKRDELTKVPMNPVLTEVESPVSGVACFDVQIECLGDMPVSGYLARPADARRESLPAVLWVHGAGTRSSVIRADVAAVGMLVLDINAHGIPNGKPIEYYRELEAGRLKNYRHDGKDNRETCYFLGMYLRLIRAMDFLTAQPEWDGKILIARGSSQGGGQALVAAGLEPRVTALFSNVPAMCDHTGAINGWPRLVPRDDAGNPDPQVQQVSRYFDAMNFATRTKADAFLAVGFIDNTCRPTTVYAAYNNLPGKKRMLNKPLMKHAYPPEWNDVALEAMKEHIRARLRTTSNGATSKAAAM